MSGSYPMAAQPLFSSARLVAGANLSGLVYRWWYRYTAEEVKDDA